MKKNRFRSTVLCIITMAGTGMAQTPQAKLPPLPAPMNVPKPAPATDAPYAPQPILPGGIVVPLFPPNSPYLKKEKLREPEVYTLNTADSGRIASIIGIHNPSIEFHAGNRPLNTGTTVI